ncbi:hypothetical protein CMV_023954 [Castanea mollissima]|uniref:F-box associated beta-propeller type 1 domain-containing protein n=1 Tax=Castanea mollissima TaxID=60419 RepID=A0A8J4VA44_9ROSI|nr:hypothetical protein CMV_023954 [Castanea mollissima]
MSPPNKTISSTTTTTTCWRYNHIPRDIDSSITTPYFISTHLNNNNNNSYNKNHDNCYMIHMSNLYPPYNRPVCKVALGRTFDRISKVQYPFDFTPGGAHVFGSCNGLLLCLADFGSVVYLWNPSIKKFKKLPGTCLGKLRDLTTGFAYHSKNNDYKVVRISCSRFSPTMPLPLPLPKVYTLSLDSWKRVGYNLTTNVTFINNYCFLTIPLVSGALHWMVQIIEGEENRIIALAFDVNSEKFKKLALPHGFIKEDTLHRYLASFKEKLAFITCEPIEQPGFPCQYSIWVMKEYHGIVESWNKLFVIPFEREVQCLAFTEYGSLLVGHMYDPVERQQEVFKFALD